nr:response regulator [Microvirga zambiensis]
MAHAPDAISIVYDNQIGREAMTDILFSAGFIPELCQSADEFLKPSRLRSTSCLIADMQLPRVTGIDPCDHLVASGKAIPTILVTSRSGDDQRARALRTGASYYLSKPFSDSELLPCINSTPICQTARKRRT